MATKKRVNKPDLTLRNLHAYKRELKAVTEALKAVDQRLHAAEETIDMLVRRTTPAPPETV